MRALVQWWGGYGQTTRPYLWKEKPTDTGYKEDWSDPRKPEKICGRTGRGNGTKLPLSKDRRDADCKGPVSPVREDTTRHDSWQGYTSALRAALPAIAPGLLVVATGLIVRELCSGRHGEKTLPDPKKNGSSLAFFVLFNYLYISYLKW